MKKLNLPRVAAILLPFVIAVSCDSSSIPVIEGDMKTFHKITITVNGPETSEYDTINPFTDYRMEAEFRKGDEAISVPGYYSADGNAAETSARSGNKWRVVFSPPSAGEWQYTLSFVKGRNAAISNDSSDGNPCCFDGISGSLLITESDKSSPDLRAKGRIVYTGERYLKYSGSGEFFLKGGTDSPENLLGYNDFDGTWYGGNNKARSGEATPNLGLHSYDPHKADWKEGDPQWQDGKGKGLIGALNYLSSKGVNSIYFITMNILGDGEDVWPYTDRNERYRFDCSKLDQWEIVFEHAEKLGMMLHIVLQETENQCLLDCGKLDVQRKLYLRELVARFSHHLAITWNLGEEQHEANFSPYGQTYADTKLTADYLRKIDPWDNFIVIHTHSAMDQRRKDMTQYLGFRNVEGPSVQCGSVNDVHSETLYWINRSSDSLHKWVVCSDEIGQHWKGALPDQFDPGHDTIRHKVLWGNLMAGGGGVEWYFGYRFPHSDLNCEDFRSREKLWEQTTVALDFFRNKLPFSRMQSSDELTKDPGDYCFSEEGKTYAVYLPEGKASEITLAAGTYSVQWYNPRTGGELRKGSVETIKGGKADPGNPPETDGKDWVCLITSTE
ncbi:MAG: DUF5060 domain-containing protein [Bacteroidales bacterium]|nr:DUF5060 domain-containing protein [Bacteroidales bacterium]